MFGTPVAPAALLRGRFHLEACMSFELHPELMVSVSGIRGRVGEALTPEVVARFAAAFGAHARDEVAAGRGGRAAGEGGGGSRPAVVLGRDSRTSGPMFQQVAAAALQSVGCDVIVVGLVPTPTALLAIRHHGAAGGIVLTASHNPVEWNALKLASAAGMFLDGEESARLRRYVADRPIPRAGWDGLGELIRDDGAVDRHLAAVLGVPYVDVDAIRRRRFRVALDCVRGAGAVLLPRLLEALGCEVVGLELEPDGRFTREPEPIAANLGGLERLVRESGADLGLATDPDADRLSLVDGAGRAIGEDYTLALAAAAVLARHAGPVVTNLSTSRVVEDVARAAGVEFRRAPVGEINVARAMEAAGAVVGGEGNGGVILPAVHHTRDSAVAAALVLQLLAETGSSLAEQVADRASYTIVKDKLPRDAGELAPTYDALEAELAAPVADRQDGLWLGWPDDARWLHLRPSGTEPILRIIAEAPDEAGARALVEGARRALAAAGGGAASGAGIAT
jgi:phosphomannomutase